MSMSKSNSILTDLSLLLLLLLITHSSVCSGLPLFAGLKPSKTTELDRDLGTAAAASCSGTFGVGQCLTELVEMESETSRRILLMQKRYISYETLKRDIVPCNKPGASYYNCNAGQANPYTRGCEIIAGCRNSILGVQN